MAMTTVQPETAPANPKRVAIASLAKHETYHGFRAFANLDSDYPVDRAARFLSEAECIISFMSAAFIDSSTLLDKSNDSEVDNRAGGIIAGALDGVGSLISLAGYLLDEKGE